MKADRFKYKLYGRFKGRKKSDLLLKKYLNKYDVDIKKNIIKNAYNILDIGSGSGENTLFLSKKNKNSIIIACELFEDGNINLCNQIFINKIKNIFLYKGNVLELFDKLKNESFFDEIWILFPDPWPKARHHKRRLMNEYFIKYVHYILKNSGSLMIATDSKSYIEAIIKLIYLNQEKFIWKNQRYEDWEYKILNLPLTKFYKKSLKSNQNSMFFQLQKI
tara:strand:- start:126 stop:785 length:660 start_codon:yes stop_codon:yes gene_type:complete